MKMFEKTFDNLKTDKDFTEGIMFMSKTELLEKSFTMEDAVKTEDKPSSPQQSPQ